MKNNTTPPDDDSYDVINKANNGLKLWENYPEQGQYRFITRDQFCDFDDFDDFHYSDSIRYP